MEASQAQLDAVPRPAENGKIPDEVELARGEVVEEVKIVDWRGLALTLPPKLPASFMFDMIEGEVKGGDDPTAANTAYTHAVYKLLGQDQWLKAKRHGDDLGLTLEDFASFVTTVLEAYGDSSGESLASVDGSESDGG